MEKVPYMLVVGDKEVEAGGVNVRLRTGDNLGSQSLDEVVALILADCEEPFKRGGMRYSFDYSGQVVTPDPLQPGAGHRRGRHPARHHAER